MKQSSTCGGPGRGYDVDRPVPLEIMGWPTLKQLHCTLGNLKSR